MVMSSSETKMLVRSMAEAIHIMPVQMKTGRAKNSPMAGPPPERALNFSSTGA